MQLQGLFCRVGPTAVIRVGVVAFIKVQSEA